MNNLIPSTCKRKDTFVNEITEYLDNMLKVTIDSKSFYNYMMEYDTNIIIIRYPGATRGRIIITDEGVISSIEIYKEQNMNRIYRDGTEEGLKQFIGRKISL